MRQISNKVRENIWDNIWRKRLCFASEWVDMKMHKVKMPIGNAIIRVRGPIFHWITYEASK